MSWILFFAGFFSAILAGIMGIKLETSAAKSLLKDIKVKPLNMCKSVNGEAYWVVELKIGKGNLLAKLFGDKATIEICPLVRFEGPDGTNIRALVFEADPQVINKDKMRSTFQITRNSMVTLAVVKRSSEDLMLYQFGGFAAEMPLDKTYDATIIIRDKRFNFISEHRIKDYIRDGNVVVDKENDYEV